MRTAIVPVICTAMCWGADPVATVTVADATLDVNGTTSVPLGLFGTHAVSLTSELIADLGIECNRELHTVPAPATHRFKGANAQLPVFIDCMGDRFQPPSMLVNADWRAYMQQCGRGYGKLWEGKNQDGIVQLWNEPYLNWAERSAGDERASTINQKWYDTSSAVEGGPVTTLKSKLTLSHFRWRSLWPVRYGNVYNPKTKANERQRFVGFNIPMPVGATVGTVFTAPETRYWRMRAGGSEPGVALEWTVERLWYPEDPAAAGYWSGPQNLELYAMLYKEWATALRQANPRTTILAGWDFNYDAGNWAVWKQLYRPLLKEFPTLIDGVTEHHYGIPVEAVQAWYEAAASDGWAITGKATTSWNTECQGVLDPAVFGASSNANDPGKNPTLAIWEARYNAADIVGLIARMPDKARSRTIHRFSSQEQFAQTGGAYALRLVKPLRGTLLPAASSHPGLWVAASRNADGEVVIACTNHSTAAMEVHLAAPWLDTAARTLRRVVVTTASGALAISETPLAAAQAMRLESRETAVLLVAKPGSSATTITRRQYFAKEGALPSDGVQSIALTAADLAGARAAWMRFTVTGPTTSNGILGRGTATASIGAVTIRHDGSLPVIDAPLELSTLTPGTLTIATAAGPASTVVACSVIIER